MLYTLTVEIAAKDNSDYDTCAECCDHADALAREMQAIVERWLHKVNAHHEHLNHVARCAGKPAPAPTYDDEYKRMRIAEKHADTLAYHDQAGEDSRLDGNTAYRVLNSVEISGTVRKQKWMISRMENDE